MIYFVMLFAPGIYILQVCSCTESVCALGYNLDVNEDCCSSSPNNRAEEQRNAIQIVATRCIHW